MCYKNFTTKVGWERSKENKKHVPNVSFLVPEKGGGRLTEVRKRLQNYLDVEGFYVTMQNGLCQALHPNSSMFMPLESLLILWKKMVTEKVGMEAYRVATYPSISLSE